jgi:hypothetical protein
MLTLHVGCKSAPSNAAATSRLAIGSALAEMALEDKVLPFGVAQPA